MKPNTPMTLTTPGAVRTRRITATGPAGPLAARVLIPDTAAAGRAPLVALHGIARDACEIARGFAPEAARTGRTVIVPHFAEDRWPVFQRIPRRARPDRALLALLAALREAGLIDDAPVDIFGFSGGAQLAHRFAMLYPEAAGRLHLGAAGWYTLPDTGLAYPVGLGPDRRGDDSWGRRMASGLAAFLDRRFDIHVGALDTGQDPSLRRAPLLDAAQGTNRLARARRYAAAIAERQRAAGLQERAEVHVLPDCGHDFGDCARHGLAARVAAH